VLISPQVPAVQEAASTHEEPSKKVYVPSGYTHFVQLVADVSHSEQGAVQAVHWGSSVLTFAQVPAVHEAAVTHAPLSK